MDNEEERVLISLGWTRELLDIAKGSPETREFARRFLNSARQTLAMTGQTALTYFRSHPGLSLVQLAKQLGTSAIGLTMAVYEESLEQHSVRETAKDLLTRRILEVFPTGWTIDNSAAKINLVDWLVQLQDSTPPSIGKAGDRVLDALLKNCPPYEGWKPAAEGDPTIDLLFDTYWQID